MLKRTLWAVALAALFLGTVLRADRAVAQETREKRPVPVEFIILSKNGISAMPEFRADLQVASLNAWFQGSVKFEMSRARTLTKADTKTCGKWGTVNPENFYDSKAAYNDRTMFAECYGAPGAINVVIAKTVSVGGSPLNGLAVIFAPLDSPTPPTVLIAANIFLTGAVTLTHEIGHILGFQHTATYGQLGPNEVYWYHEQMCGKTFSYPYFAIYDRWSLEVDPLHEQWPGRSNPMGYLNIYTFIFPNFFRGGYNEVFRGIIDCWYAESFSTQPLGTRASPVIAE